MAVEEAGMCKVELTIFSRGRWQNKTSDASNYKIVKSSQNKNNVHLLKRYSQVVIVRLQGKEEEKCG